MVILHYFAVMVTVLQFCQFFLWISSKITKKIYFQNKKIKKKSANDIFLAVLLHFYDLEYLNLTKSRLSNQKSGMVPEVTLIQNSKINIVTKFQVSIFKNDEVRGGKKLPPPTWNKLAQRQRGIGLSNILVHFISSTEPPLPQYNKKIKEKRFYIKISCPLWIFPPSDQASSNFLNS